MIIDKNNITTKKVATALGCNLTNVGGLCTHTSINPWSKWKPIKSDVTTMTVEELIKKNYGIKIIEANTPKDLIVNINNNNGRGYKYEKPFLTYRLGDFRNYNSEAPMPVGTTYSEGVVIKIGGVSPKNHPDYEKEIGGMETISSDTTLGADELYKNFTDHIGNPIQVHRGVVIAFANPLDGNNVVFYSRKYYWWTGDAQLFAGKDVFIYECYTNAEASGDKPYTSNAKDRFFALPYPKCRATISAEFPTKNKQAYVIVDPFFLGTIYDKINYRMTISSEGKEYSGGSITNIEVRICKDREGKNILARFDGFEDIMLGAEDKHNFGFKTIFVPNNTDPNVWFVVLYNKAVQFSTNVRYDMSI